MNQDLPIKLIKEETEKIYLKRFAEPAEVANLVCFLAANKRFSGASKFNFRKQVSYAKEGLISFSTISIMYLGSCCKSASIIQVY